MTEHDLERLLAAAAQTAQEPSPVGDPLAALRHARRAREQRRGHLVVLAFVVFVLVLQLSPSEALGVDRPAGPGSVVAARG